MRNVARRIARERDHAGNLNLTPGFLEALLQPGGITL